MKNIHIMRHAHAGSSKQFNGTDDSPLDELGIQQAEQKREQCFKGAHFDFVKCGTKQRHIQTAEIITNGKVEIIPDKRLDEIACGKFEGLKRSLPLEIAFLASMKTGAFDVETWEELMNRTDGIFDEMLIKNKNDDGLVVTSTMNVTAFKKSAVNRMISMQDRGTMSLHDNGVGARVKNCDHITITPDIFDKFPHTENEFVLKEQRNF